jgi:hypothetical protein
VLDRLHSWLRRPSRKQLLGEIERLNQRFDEVNKVMMRELELEPGGSLTMGIEPCFGAKVLAYSFAETLGGAANWQALEIGPFDSFQGKLVVTVRRLHGETPEFMVGKLKDRVADLEEALAAEQAEAVRQFGRAEDACDVLRKMDSLLYRVQVAHVGALTYPSSEEINEVLQEAKPFVAESVVQK